MSRINVDSIALVDPRFGHLAQLLGLADADHARSKVEYLWLDCTERGEYTLPRWLVEQRLGPKAFPALIESELGKVDGRQPDRIYICGSRKRTGWKAQLQQSAAKGGKTRAQKSSRVAGRFTSHLAGASTSAPAPAPAPALIREESGSPDGLASISEARKARESKPIEAKGHPDHQRVIDGFHERYKSAYGTKPTWDKKSIGQLSALLKKHPADVLFARMDFMFSGKAPWPPPPYSLDVFVKHIDRWVGDGPVQSAIPFRRVKEID